MPVSARSVGDVRIVKVSGVVDSRAAGPLYDTLINNAADGATLIVDLSDVPALTHAGARGLIVAAKLLESAKGSMRICGAKGPIAAILHGLGFNHLLKNDPTLEAMMAARSSEAGPRVVSDPVATIRRQPELPFADSAERFSHSARGVLFDTAA